MKNYLLRALSGASAVELYEFLFTAETQSSQRSEYFFIKNSLLCALSASAVSSLLNRYNQNSHPKICASRSLWLGTYSILPTPDLVASVFLNRNEVFTDKAVEIGCTNPR